MNAEQLIDALRKVPEDCVLVKNQVGNLSILDADNYQIGHINLRTAEVDLYDDDSSPTPAPQTGQNGAKAG